MIIRALIRSQISQTLSTFTGKTSVKRKKNGQLKKTGTGRKVLFGLLFAYLAIVFIGMFLGMGYGMAVFFLDGSAGRYYRVCVYICYGGLCVLLCRARVFY